MKSTLRWVTLTLVTLLLGASSLAADRVLAKAKDFQITQEDLDNAFVVYRASLAIQGRDVPEQQRANVERQLVEKMALTRLLLGRANDSDRKNAKEKVEKLLAAEKEKAKSQARYEAQIRALGMAPEDFEKQLHERAVCEQVIERDLKPTLGITPEKVRAFYDQNNPRFQQPDRLRLRQVVLALKQPNGAELSDTEKADKQALARKLVERARKGEELAALAREFSDDPSGRDRGGEYVFPLGRMIPEFENAVTRLATNTISDVIQTPAALHVVQVVARIPSEVVPFEQVEPQIRSALELEETNRIIPDYQKRLFTEAGVVFSLPPARER